MCIIVTYEDRRTLEYSCWRKWEIEVVSLMFGRGVDLVMLSRNDSKTYTQAIASVRSNR